MCGVWKPSSAWPASRLWRQVRRSHTLDFPACNLGPVRSSSRKVVVPSRWSPDSKNSASASSQRVPSLDILIPVHSLSLSLSLSPLRSLHMWVTRGLSSYKDPRELMTSTLPVKSWGLLRIFIGGLGVDSWHGSQEPITKANKQESLDAPPTLTPLLCPVNLGPLLLLGAMLCLGGAQT